MTALPLTYRNVKAQRTIPEDVFLDIDYAVLEKKLFGSSVRMQINSASLEKDAKNIKEFNLLKQAMDDLLGEKPTKKIKKSRSRVKPPPNLINKEDFQRYMDSLQNLPLEKVKSEPEPEPIKKRGNPKNRRMRFE